MGGVERGVRKALRRIPAEHRTGGLAMVALELARSIDAGPDAKELPGLSRELRAALTELARFEAPGAKGGKVDELNARRQKRRGA
jgi:hypothetical protein